MDNPTPRQPVAGSACPPAPSPRAQETLAPTWVGIVDLVTAILAGLWVPMKLGLLAFPGSIDLWVDMLFVVLAGPSAWQALHTFFGTSYSQGQGRSRRVLWRACLDLSVALPAVTLAGLTGAFPEPLWCLKLLALRHIFRFPQILSRLGLSYPALGRLITLGLVMPLVLHWTATGWIMLGADAGVTDLRLRYVRAMYWAITTMASVGYGDITPQTVPQMLYACGVMVAGVSFFGFVLGNMASFLARIDAAKAHQEDMRDRLETFMRYHRVPQALRQRVREYHRFLWQSRRGYDGGAALSDLPLSLRADLLLCVNRDIVYKSPVLQGASPSLLRDLVLQLKPHVALPGDVIFRAGMPADGMYLILEGEIDILGPQDEVVTRLGEGSFFGEMALLRNSPRNATARAGDHCFLFLLEREAFDHAVRRYPDFAARVAEMARQRAGG